jgi:CRISPR-associated protein Cas1
MDPINATLSYVYGLLTKECFVRSLSVGFDPYIGFYHRHKYGKPALALDLMEEFRPIVADSIVITLFNTGELSNDDFIIKKAGVAFKKDSKKKVIKAYEKRINTEIKHPFFGYKVSYRRAIEVQARLLARCISGEIEEYPYFYVR